MFNLKVISKYSTNDDYIYSGITKNKFYKVFDGCGSQGGYNKDYLIIDDCGVWKLIPSVFFMTKEEEREFKLNKILSKKRIQL